jgi:hypothetical protein
MSKLINNKIEKDMLQVIEEYIDGGYVYTVQDTDEYDALMQKEQDTKAKCLAETNHEADEDAQDPKWGRHKI